MKPGELAAFLNDYFDSLARPLRKHGVEVTEFRADAIMCAWTGGMHDVAVRRQPILAALEAAQAIAGFKERHRMFASKLRIGLEAGEVYVGHAGGGGRFVYSIVGDSANTASRVEGLNKHVGSQILATGAVVAGFDDLVTRHLGAFLFVGKTEALPIYEILAFEANASDHQRRLRDAFAEAMSAYLAADWALAGERFDRILADYPGDGPSQFLLARCRRFVSDPARVEDPSIVRMDAK
jgi:adenylate cyclase